MLDLEDKAVRPLGSNTISPAIYPLLTTMPFVLLVILLRVIHKRGVVAPVLEVSVTSPLIVIATVLSKKLLLAI